MARTPRNFPHWTRGAGFNPPSASSATGCLENFAQDRSLDHILALESKAPKSPYSLCLVRPSSCWLLKSMHKLVVIGEYQKQNLKSTSCLCHFLLLHVCVCCIFFYDTAQIWRKCSCWRVISFQSSSSHALRLQQLKDISIPGRSGGSYGSGSIL